MSGPTHLAAGAALCLGAEAVLAPHVSAGVRLLVGCAILIGSLAPDLDEPRSTLPRAIPGASILIWLLKLAVSNPLTWWVAGLWGPWSWNPARVIRRGKDRWHWIVAHRGFSHSPAALVVASTVAGIGTAWALLWASRRAPSVLAWLALPDTRLAQQGAAVLVALGLAAGIASHLVLDRVTPQGRRGLDGWRGFRHRTRR